jgi:hypothetical protein
MVMVGVIVGVMEMVGVVVGVIEGVGVLVTDGVTVGVFVTVGVGVLVVVGVTVGVTVHVTEGVGVIEEVGGGVTEGTTLSLLELAIDPCFITRCKDRESLRNLTFSLCRSLLLGGFGIKTIYILYYKMRSLYDMVLVH